MCFHCSDIQAGKFSSSNRTGEGEGGEREGTDGPVIPLLMQNKPPVETSDDKLNDLELRYVVSDSIIAINIIIIYHWFSIQTNN